MKIDEVMTRDVITTSPGTPIHEAARLMVNHTISGLPVVDDAGTLVGVISEGDLILRQRQRERQPWWRTFFQDGERLAREYQKAAGTTVGEVMTAAVISVSPDLPIESAAVILDRHHIRRLALFGSVLKGVDRPDSDVDLLVEFEPGQEPGLLALADMEAALSALLGGRPVDLRTPQDLSRYFRDEVIRTAEVQYPR